MAKHYHRQNLLVVVVSYLFYGWWDWRFRFSSLSPRCAAISAGWWCSAMRHRGRKENHLRRKHHHQPRHTGNIQITTTSSADNFDALMTDLGLHADVPTLNLILPVGISFYTFQALSYTIDVYRGKIAVAKGCRGVLRLRHVLSATRIGPIERKQPISPVSENPEVSTMSEPCRVVKWYYGILQEDSHCRQRRRHREHGLRRCAAPQRSQSVDSRHPVFISDIRRLLRLFRHRHRCVKTLRYQSDATSTCPTSHATSQSFGDDGTSASPLGFGITSTSRSEKPCPDGKWSKRLDHLSGQRVLHGANWTFIIWGAYHALLFMPLLLLGKNRRHTGIVAERRADRQLARRRRCWSRSCWWPSGGWFSVRQTSARRQTTSCGCATSQTWTCPTSQRRISSTCWNASWQSSCCCMGSGSTARHPKPSTSACRHARWDGRISGGFGMDVPLYSVGQTFIYFQF